MQISIRKKEITSKLQNLQTFHGLRLQQVLVLVRVVLHQYSQTPTFYQLSIQIVIMETIKKSFELHLYHVLWRNVVFLQFFKIC